MHLQTQQVLPNLKRLSAKTIINESLDDEELISKQVKAMELDDETCLELSMERLTLDHFVAEIPKELIDILDVMD